MNEMDDIFYSLAALRLFSAATSLVNVTMEGTVGDR